MCVCVRACVIRMTIYIYIYTHICILTHTPTSHTIHTGQSPCPNGPGTCTLLFCDCQGMQNCRYIDPPQRR